LTGSSSPLVHSSDPSVRVDRPNGVAGFLAICLILTTMVVPGGLLASEASIAFVNWSRLTNEAPQAEAALGSLEEEFGPRNRELAAELSDVRQLEERLSRDGAVMTDDEQRRLQREVVTRKRDLRRVEEEFREDFNMRRNEELNRLHRLVIDTVGEVAESRGFDLVITDGVVYASDRVDVTELVLDRLRERHQNR
jgi:outer membrane protein